MTVDEERRQKGQIELRHGSQISKERYNEAAKWTIVGGLEVAKVTTVTRDDGAKEWTKIVFGKEGKHEAVVTYKPFGVEFRRDGEAHVVLNDRVLLNVEHWRPKIEKEKNENAGDDQKEGEKVEEAAPENEVDETNWWEESFGGNTDSKPRGPESVAMDVTFPGYEHVFGLPEHTGPMSLKETRYGELLVYVKTLLMRHTEVGTTSSTSRTAFTISTCSSTLSIAPWHSMVQFPTCKRTRKTRQLACSGSTQRRLGLTFLKKRSQITHSVLVSVPKQTPRPIGSPRAVFWTFSYCSDLRLKTSARHIAS